MKQFVGTKAPDFHIHGVSGDGEMFQDLCLEAYKGHWLVLFFYPMDFTFVCPTELTSFSEAAARFDQVNAKILAVSTDSEYCHQAWIRNGLGKLTYPMGADKTMSMCADYGVLLEDEGVALRGLFLIDPDQVIRYSVIHDNQVGRNPDEVLRVLQALQTGSLCGAGWTPGKPVLTPAAEDPKTPKTVSTPLTPYEPIRVYTLPGCSYCRQVKEFLTEHGLPWVEIDLSTDETGQAFMDEREYTALPVTVIDNYEIEGFRLDRIKEVLRLN